MLLRQGQARLALLLIVLCFFASIVIILYHIRKSHVQCDCSQAEPEPGLQPARPDSEAAKQSSEHKLCLLVPFRDRFEELLEFAPYISSFLGRQRVKHEIWVMNQVDGFRFNRAYLINVGFRESSQDCDYIAMHDVDLLPQNDALQYRYPSKGPLHISSPELHPKYDYPTFIGGILLVTRVQYRQLDGMSNKYWGWGLEDDEFFVRMRQANLPIERPQGIKSGRKSFKHAHSGRARERRGRDGAKCYNQRNATRRRDRQTGLSTTFYTVAARRSIQVDGSTVNFLDIQLECDRVLTPWCNCTGAPPDTNPPDRTRDEDVVVPILPRKNKKHE